MFRAFPSPIIRSFLLYIQHSYISCRFGNRGSVEFFEKIKFGKFVGLVGFIKKKFVTMHGHMNVKLQRFVEKIIRSLLEYDVRGWLLILKGNILRSVFF
jgi:hypothetical protein